MPANFDEGGVKTERIREFQMSNTKYLTKRTILLQMQRYLVSSWFWVKGRSCEFEPNWTTIVEF